MQHVLIADDHAVARRGLREILLDAYHAAEVVEAESADEVLRRLPERRWDIVLLDILMPGMSVFDLIAQIHRDYPDLPVLVLTGTTEPAYVMRSMQAGAHGFIYKDRAPDDLLEAVEKVMAGGTYLRPETALELANLLRESSRPAPHRKLSEREIEVFRLIARGRAVKEVACDLGLSDKTVATYLGRIREKTGLTSHVEIARYALQHGLVD